MPLHRVSLPCEPLRLRNSKPFFFSVVVTILVVYMMISIAATVQRDRQLCASTGIFAGLGLDAAETLQAMLVLRLTILLPFKELVQEFVHQFRAVPDVLQRILAAPNKIAKTFYERSIGW